MIKLDYIFTYIIYDHSMKNTISSNLHKYMIHKSSYLLYDLKSLQISNSNSNSKK